MRAALIGYGRMGRAIDAVLVELGHQVVLRVGRCGDAQGRPLRAALAAEKPDVAFEFTAPAAAGANLETLLAAGTPTVCGTTGWDAAPTARLADATGTPALFAANFAIGIAVMKRLVAEAADQLRPFGDFTPAIVERHHSAKKDAPSGTAKLLARTLADGGWPEVAVVSLRQGGQPGEHTLYFEGAGECLTITHQARSRSVFALGAVRAAEWLVGTRPKGCVTFADFLERTGSCASV